MTIDEMIKEMTVEEKAAMCSGMDFWHTAEFERLGIKKRMVCDGPHGLRKQEEKGDHLGKNASIEAVCFPAACATACSFDKELLYEMGKTLGNECKAEEVSVLLGPAMNIKRSPLCGRNFEYISEDPFLTGELASAYVKGLQAEGIGASPKHFAVNNQESDRMYVSAEVDERTLREMYLSPFEMVVKKSFPWTMMCSYNRLNGVYVSENRKLLRDILKNEWGFEGCVISDWGAVSDRVEGIRAGMDLEMPGNGGKNDKQLIDAVENGILSMEELDDSVARILEMVFRCKTGSDVFDREKDHEKAVRIAKECIVLLKNEKGNKGRKVLPLSKEEKIAFIGGFAETPRYQGGGSSHINPHRVNNVVELGDDYGRISYAKGFSATEDKAEKELYEIALQTVDRADKIVVFAGLPDSFESEGYDRVHMRLPECQNQLIEKLCETGKPVIVVLHNGSPVEMPWCEKVQGIIEAYLGGEGIAEAILDILYGKANPCGKIAETFPLRLEETPSYLNFPGDGQKVNYAEGVFVGYRYYDSRHMNVLFPFGHGLSYTEFEYEDIRVSSREIDEKGKITVSVKIRNTGEREGKEIVQLYVKDETKTFIRPEKELKAFETVRLAPREAKWIEMELDYRSFALYLEDESRWYAPKGEYTLLIGASSKDIRLSSKIKIRNCKERKLRIDGDILVGELLKYEKGRIFVEQYLTPFINEFLGERASEELGELHFIMAQRMPIRALRSFSSMTNQDVDNIVNKLKEIFNDESLQ